MFKNIQVYRLTSPWNISAEELNTQLSRISFAQCASNEMQSQGWASPRNNDMLVHCVNHQFLIALATEKKLLPSSVINQVTKSARGRVRGAARFCARQKGDERFKGASD
jgi:recombination associated protein RdgC